MPNRFIPALKYHWLTPLYDFIIKILVPEKRIRKVILEVADLKGFESILDYGCGTGTQMILAKTLFPNLKIEGYDIDDRIINVAKKKINKVGIEIPILLLVPENKKYDVIICSWVYHHLTTSEKIAATKLIKFHLKEKGFFIIGDWGRPTNFLMKTAFFVLQLLDNFTTTRDNKNGLIPEILKKEGFSKIENKSINNTLLGSFYIWKASI